MRTFIALAWVLHAAAAAAPAPAKPASTETVVLAGGCFWGVEAVYEHMRGVQRVAHEAAGGQHSAATLTAGQMLLEAEPLGLAPAARLAIDQLLDLAAIAPCHGCSPPYSAIQPRARGSLLSRANSLRRAHITRDLVVETPASISAATSSIERPST